MKRLLLAAAALVISLAPVAAQNLDVIKERKEIFKSFGPHAQAGAAMVRGEAPFDLDRAKAIFAAYVQGAGQLPDLFPDDSKEGGETEALPVIWERKSEFVAGFEKLELDAGAAFDAVTDLDSFRTNWGTVMGNCGTCHRAFRLQKN
ncbi:MAG: c-type cytochrome [Hyphomicrobiaceae bacterium]